jgi:signal transduction histidine kinase
MATNTRADILIDSRHALRVYTGVAGVAGLALLLWGPLWTGWLGPLPLSRGPVRPTVGDFVTARALGVFLVLAAGVAAARTSSADSRRRRQTILGLAILHVLIIAAILVRYGSTFDRGHGGLLLGLLISAPVLMAYAWSNADGHTPGESFRATGLFGSGQDRAIEPIRSRYEADIRRAAQQEERNRLARDLHDSVKQQIFVIQTAAATAQTRFDDDPAGAKAALEDVRRAAREAIAEMEAMLDGLSAAPIENTGLVEAIRKQGEALGFRTGALVECEVGPLPPSETWPPGTHEAIFRVAQEALANVGRHARADRVRVDLSHRDGDFELVVHDDGAGFDREGRTGGLGLDNMRERARELRGTVNVTAKPGAGTTVRLTVPASVFPEDTWRGHRNRMFLFAGIMAGSLALWFWTHRSTVEGVGGAVFVVVFNVTLAAVEAAAYFRTRPRRERRP